MPTVDIDPDELRELTGKDETGDEELKEDLFALGLEFEGRTEDGEFELEFAPDRLDRLSVEGIARSLTYQHGDSRGVHVPSTNKPEWTIEVDESVPEERPYVTGAVIRDVDLDEDALDSLIQLQEKLHATMGRKRAKGAIGIHDLTMLKGRDALRASESASSAERSSANSRAAEPRDDGDEPRASPETEGSSTIEYVGVEPDEDRFVPLDSDAELTPADVLEDHPTGETYADLVSEYERYPAIYDDLGLFSFPPVINGRRTEVTTDSRDLFVEMTGTDQWTIDRMLNIVCYALAARGATLEEVTVEYPDHEIVRPDLSTTEKTVAHDRIETILGVDFDPEEVIDLAERSGLEAEKEASDDGDLVYEVTIPPYRVDVLHPLDVIDDLGRAYGFNELEPNYPEVGTVGGRHERSRLERSVREQLVGLGFEDLLNFHMISEEENYERVDVEPDAGVYGAGEPATIKGPYSEDFTMLRTWVTPSLLMVLERNTHRAYPQDLAEIGFTAEVDESENTGIAERRRIGAVLASHEAGYEDAKARLQALCRRFDVDLETPPTEHPTFISGRTASVVIDGEAVGVIGEFHPTVLVEHDLEVPVAGFEFDLAALR
ncbi:phenylalanine--tRNA ligase subunit beta [Natronobacterium gregoryi]|uniref:Phenylalanine--tRNA ligase beta subunit n=2 Tax=Natronobacterium gregoryi TaxID=44930 RepID=L0AFK5_NATGS|nr:phenylalanine--tRNA ligase subunit beta [Natronobacterium gregoryi]AFZ72596.1 phenylalanyl-tRNA synthetase, beta subunit [Natronobacterium gregoryi SP2]ELY71976.1 phenylalanyl-tRNA ligase subunit beta [Natronobacterium gregoryi SP2]PLK19196.1 phenylalanine--tRNA ligase subunit beta [Natronobacterium gregoryi SP2]SFJ57337.1 phenylalanyl-tRNA synthetase beta subunit [Natronobacterium gregoryi]